MGYKRQRGINWREIELTNRQRPILSLQITAIAELVGNVVFPEMVMAEEFVSTYFFRQLLDALAPIAFPDELPEPAEQLVNLVVVNRRFERHLDYCLALPDQGRRLYASSKMRSKVW